MRAPLAIWPEEEVEGGGDGENEPVEDTETEEEVEGGGDGENDPVEDVETESELPDKTASTLSLESKKT